MDIPNDLNKLLAQLKKVTSEAGRIIETGAAGARPSAIEIDFFLRQFNFDADTMIEQIEVSNAGVFECYMFAVWNRVTENQSLMAMCPKP